MHAEDWARVESRLVELEETNFELLRKLALARTTLWRLSGYIASKELKLSAIPQKVRFIAGQAYKESRP
jgi:hypothetical protein